MGPEDGWKRFIRLGSNLRKTQSPGLTFGWSDPIREESGAGRRVLA